MVRWHANLQIYNYKIQHIPGKANILADVLSHPTDTNQGRDNNQNITILPENKFINLATMDEAPSTKEQQTLMIWAYDHPMAGHPGCDETL
jgi:hypothetical protein